MPTRPKKLRDAQRDALGRALARRVRGQVRFDTTTRAAYATDSSNYRQVPLGVVFPRDHDDVGLAARLAAEAGAALLARGAGTSLAGQCLQRGRGVDMSRHMRRVVGYRRRAPAGSASPASCSTTCAGRPSVTGLTFGPDPATHAWCTLGGMIGNNSCGTHGFYAGNTSDNVASLRVVLAGGERLEVGVLRRAALAAGELRVSRLGTLLPAWLGPRWALPGLIEQRYPDIPRRVSGFNLDELAAERRAARGPCAGRYRVDVRVHHRGDPATW